MRMIGLKVLKNKLSEYVRLAQRGETILVTDHNRVVAELVPPRPGRRPLLADTGLAELVTKGVITPASRLLTGPPPRARAITFDELMRDVEVDRADR